VENMSKHVGILTLQNTTTEGGIAQATALARAINATYGAEVEFAQYMSPARQKLVVRNDIVHGARMLIEPLSRPLESIQDVSSWADEKNLVIIGSDEIWKHHDPVYYGSFPTKTPTTTFAGCCPGNVKMPSNLACALRDQKIVTVRDMATKRAVKDACGMICDLAFDPVLLEALPSTMGSSSATAVLVYNNSAGKVRSRLGGAYPVIDVYKEAKGTSLVRWDQWCKMPERPDIGVLITLGFHPTHMGILACKPVITLDRRAKTREAVADFYGERFCLNDWNSLSTRLIEDALSSFDLRHHNDLLQQRCVKTREQLRRILECMS